MKNFIWPALLFVVYGTILCAELKDHFKQVTDKSEVHSMKNIDFIYIINLKEEGERFANCEKQLSPYDINPYQFLGINGWDLSLETLNKIGVKYDSSTMKDDVWGTFYPMNGDGKPHDAIIHDYTKTYFHHHAARGTIGVVLSHLSVLYDAYQSGYERVWIMEDNINVKKDPHLISSLIDELTTLVGDGWDVLFTDKDAKNSCGDYVPCLSYAPRPNFSPSDEGKFARRINVNEKFMSIGARYGAYSMIIQRSGIKKILDFFNTYHIFLRYDMDFYLPEGMRMYTVTDDIVSMAECTR